VVDYAEQIALYTLKKKTSFRVYSKLISSAYRAKPQKYIGRGKRTRMFYGDKHFMYVTTMGHSIMYALLIVVVRAASDEFENEFWHRTSIL